MLRFAALLSCLAMACCVSQPGEELNASATQPYVAQAGRADATQAATRDPEPVTQLAATFVPPARAPLPPKRPDFGDAPVAVALAGGQSVAAQPASTEPVTTVIATAPAAVTRLIATPVRDAAPPASAQAFAPASTTIDDDAPARPQIIRASFAPARAAAFDPATRAYGYMPPVREDDGLLVQPNSRFSVPQTVRPSLIPGQRYYAAYDNTIISCFPEQLRQALNTLAEHYGAEVEVTSGMRHNGRRGSYHRRCMAADVRVPGVAPGAVAAFARTIQGVNGVGTYRHNSVTHIDVRDYQMSWRH